MVYVIGSLRQHVDGSVRMNQRVLDVAKDLRLNGFDVFDDWIAAGPEADDQWMAYEKQKDHTFTQALAGAAAQNVLAFDLRHLTACDSAVLVLPAGKSGHLELGLVLGMGKRGYILLEGEPERYDVMYGLATGVANDIGGLLAMMGTAGQTVFENCRTFSNPEAPHRSPFMWAVAPVNDYEGES